MTLVRTLCTLALGLPLAAHAQQSSTYEEQSKLMRAPKAYASIGSDLFGDTVNLSNGTVNFKQTDVSLKGNNELAVAITRKYTPGTQAIADRPFGRWNLDIPHIHGIFSASKGWTTNGNIGGRCSNFGSPDAAIGVSPGENGSAGFDAQEFWQGTFLSTPEGGDQQMLNRAPAFTASPSTPSAWPVVTTAFWTFSCLPSLKNPSAQNTGEGFIALSPSGVSYRFDWMTSFSGPTLNNAQGKLATKEVWLLPSVVTDRFGNTVSYTYDPVYTNNVTKIAASDGRVLDISYYPASQFPSSPYRKISAVTDGTRTWSYNYDAVDLSSVVLPDSSAWTFGNTANVDLKTLSQYGDCETQAQIVASDYSWTMTHPSGASGTFHIQGRAHGRSDVPPTCALSNNYTPEIPKFYYTQTLADKTISGPGIGSLLWHYDYGAVNASWAPCDASCVFSKVVSVTDPDGKVTRYTFGTRFGLTDGRLEAVDVDGLRTTVTQYRPFGTGPYPDRVGTDDSPMMKGDGGVSNRLAPVMRKTITQQGATFDWQVVGDYYDLFARPTRVTRNSSLGFARTEATDYASNWAKWVLGQVTSVTDVASGKVMVANGYNPSSALLESVARFGLTQQSMTYNADGTLATKADGLGQTTTFSNYKRGISRNVRYADNSTESAEVNDDGTIAWIIDPMGNQTSFEYVFGRLSKITYPAAAGDPAWNATTLSLTKMDVAEFDLDAGHWRQDIVTGNGWTRTYLDALWRPAYTWTYENNSATVQTMVKTQFDHAGHPTFSSYPQRGYVAELMQGVRTFYDALGRTTEMRADSELGFLSTYTIYDPGFRKVVRDPRGNSSTTSFQAFDTPSEDAIAGIIAPEGLIVAIDRDLFGKPKSITRSGNGASATRSYIYDGYERLCKTIEPETGATLQQLDAANNVSWRAPGSNLTSATCDPGSAPLAARISFGYDNMNRLLSTNYGDGSAAIGRDYWADGQPKTVSSAGAVWTMNYNSRRLPTTQSLSFEGQTYTLRTDYNANGHPVQLTYPSATNSIATQSVAYDPDALGRPTHVGAYASALQYHPSGAVAGFTYGNGKTRAMTQNVRGLPSLAQDSGVLSDAYGYDQNGNVNTITDQINAGPGGANTSRSMDYDGLDRLKIANAPGLWGNASYGYDVLDNIRTSTIGSRVNTYGYGARNLLDSLQSTAGGFSYNYTYDNRGNLTTRGGQTFGFDLGNRLTTATNLDTYVYDGFGRRVKTTAVDGTVTVSVYSPAGQILYTRRTGGPNPPQSTQYIYLHTHQIAEVKK